MTTKFEMPVHERLSIEYNPHVQPDDTLALLKRIPSEGPWRLPEPYDADNASSIRETWETDIRKWLGFLSDVEKGLMQVETTTELRIADGTVEAMEAFERFAWGGLGLATRDTLNSVQRGFAALLTQKSKEKLGVTTQADAVTPDDVARTRAFVQKYAESDFFYYATYPSS